MILQILIDFTNIIIQIFHSNIMIWWWLKSLTMFNNIFYGITLLQGRLGFFIFILNLFWFLKNPHFSRVKQQFFPTANLRFQPHRAPLVILSVLQYRTMAVVYRFLWYNKANATRSWLLWKYPAYLNTEIVTVPKKLEIIIAHYCIFNVNYIHLIEN